MTTAYFCIVIAIFIPLLCVWYAKFGGRGYDNRSPRDFLEKLDGPRRKAYYAQLNSWEALTPFAAGVIVAHQLHAPQPLLDNLAITFILVRLGYVYLYLTDRPLARSAVWFIAFCISISLFFIGKG